jgi:hyperosmotically inducible periplasmic protein
VLRPVKYPESLILPGGVELLQGVKPTFVGTWRQDQDLVLVGGFNPMKSLKPGGMVIALCTLGLFSQPLTSALRAQNPDNTKTNERDRSKSEPTADQQKENNGDRELARKIRQSVVSDKSLSTDAHNIKIIAQDGTVTLKGPVRSEEEKRSVEEKAADAAGGSDHVRSEIEVKPSSRNNSQ